MRILGPNQDRCASLNHDQAPAAVRRACQQKESGNGNQTKRLAAFHQRICGLFQRYGSCRSAVQPPEPARASGSSVTFEPGARTAWHAHPLGQTLIISVGCGRVQREDGPVEEIRPGDVVWIPPGVKHWHGAAPTTAMTHIAIQEKLDGKVVEWMEKVSGEQYGD
jgi:quercetin dioxygenase-like cupin family protein